ncbi:MAG: ComF family protein [Candidatus Hydrothermia bacterium]
MLKTGVFFPLNSRLGKVYSLYEYKDCIVELIHLFKYQKRWEVIDFLLSGDLIKLGHYDFIIPVPLHHVRLRERGRNQSEIISRRLRKFTGIPIITRGIKRVRYTRLQAFLNKEDRVENVRGAFKVKNPRRFEGKRILLVDDVYTTGSTMDNLARAFKGYPSVIDGLVIASSKVVAAE